MKQKFINSISLVAVCAVLSGCGDSNIKKNLEQLKAEIEHNGAMLAARASQVTRDASDRGVPLPPDVAPVLRKDAASGSEQVPDSASGLLAELNKTTNELATLADSPSFQEAKRSNAIYWEILFQKANRTRSLKNALQAKLEQTPHAMKRVTIAPVVPNNSLADESRSAGVSTIPSANTSPNASFVIRAEEDNLIVPNNSFAGVISPDVSTIPSANTSGEQAQVPTLGSSDGSTETSPVVVGVVPVMVDGSTQVDPLEAMEALSRADSIVSTVLSDLSDDEVGDRQLSRDIGRPPLVPRNVEIAGGGVLSTQTDADGFAVAMRSVGWDWLGILNQTDRDTTNPDRAIVPGQLPATSRGGTDPQTAWERVSTDEAVRRATVALLRNTEVTGAVFDSSANPEVVAAITNIGALRQLQGVPEFSGLTSDQQNTAVQLAIGMRHAAPLGGSVSLAERMRAMVIALRSMGTSFAEGDDVRVRRLLIDVGFVNEALIADTLRLYRLAGRLALVPPADRSSVVMQVLMIAGRPGGGVTETEFDSAIAEVTANPTRSISDRATQHGIDSNTTESVIAAIKAVSASGTLASGISRQVRLAIANSAPADPYAMAITNSVASRRRLGAAGGDPANGNGVSMGDLISVLPTANGLDILAASQSAAVHELSRQRTNTVEVFRIAAVPSASNNDPASAPASDPELFLPKDPKVEISNFTRNYRIFTGLNNGRFQLKNGAALTVLQKSIKDVTVSGSQTSFKEFPFNLTLPYLSAVTALPNKYIPLLYGANQNDTEIMARLVAYVIDNQGMLDSLGYYPSGPIKITKDMKTAWAKVSGSSEVGSRTGAAPYILRSLKDSDSATYNAILTQLGAAVETYLDSVRSEVLSSTYSEDNVKTREQILAAFSKNQKNYANTLSNQIKSHVDILVKAVDRNFPGAGMNIDSTAVLDWVKANIKNLNLAGEQAFKNNLYRLVYQKGTVSKGWFSNQTISDYLSSTVKDTALQTAIIGAIRSGVEQALYAIPEFVKLLSTPDQSSSNSTSASRVEEVVELSAELSASTFKDISDKVSLRKARTAANGAVDGRGFKLNGSSGQSVELGLPLFVQLKGEVSSAKATDAVTGAVAYRLGNTVIGAIQGYANAGDGFGIDGRLLETSVVASQSFGSFFVEGQIGSVSASDVHLSDWSGYRSQITVGLDTAFVSPFVQVAHRQLDRGGMFNLNETIAYVGLDMDISKLAMDTYSIDTRLLAKAGYGSKGWTSGVKDFGSTTGFSGSVEWSASLNLNSGVAFSSSLTLDTETGSAAGLTVSLDR